MSEPSKEAWQFSRWFVRQHGPRPGGSIDRELLRDRIKSNRAMLAHDESILAALDEWEERRTTALWAWQIKDEQKADNRGK